ncbi:MAG TPA: hypothetical protein VIM02_11165 [Rhizomicrobium sp.]|jgi:hypothetical protein
MKRFGKLALGALMLGGLAIAADPASARVGVSVGIGVPAYGYAHSCGWYAYHGFAAPAYCYDDGYYGGYGPVVYGSFGFRDRWGRWHSRPHVRERVVIHR